MNNDLIRPAYAKGSFPLSVYGNKPAMDACELPDAVSVNLRDLFPNMPETIYLSDGDDLAPVREATIKAMEDMDLSSISPEDSINILACEHGFFMMEGKPYVEMIKTVKKVVEERTGAYNISIKLVMYMMPREGEETIDFFKLREELGNVEGISAFDKGIPIKTRIGTVYGLEKVFNADKIILTYYDDPREVYAHNYFRRSFKAFTMDLMRMETRGLYHRGFGRVYGMTQSDMILPCSVYDSDYIQSKWVGACFMRSTPCGMSGVLAGNDLYELDDKITAENLKYYPYVTTLISTQEDYFGILDGQKWAYYLHSGGVIHGMFTMAFDPYDRPDFKEGEAPVMGGSFVPHGYKGMVMNEVWYGCSSWLPITRFPCVQVGKEIPFMLKNDHVNKEVPYLEHSLYADTLPEAVEMMKERAKTDKYIIFDGSFGHINCSRSEAEELIRRAPEIREKVNKVLYPRYMEQRGMTIPDYMK